MPHGQLAFNFFTVEAIVTFQAYTPTPYNLIMLLNTIHVSLFISTTWALHFSIPGIRIGIGPGPLSIVRLRPVP